MSIQLRFTNVHFVGLFYTATQKWRFPHSIPGYGGCGEDGCIKVFKATLFIWQTVKVSPARMMSSVKIDSEVWYYAGKDTFPVWNKKLTLIWNHINFFTDHSRHSVNLRQSGRLPSSLVMKRKKLMEFPHFLKVAVMIPRGNVILDAQRILPNSGKVYPSGRLPAPVVFQTKRMCGRFSNMAGLMEPGWDLCLLGACKSKLFSKTMSKMISFTRECTL